MFDDMMHRGLWFAPTWSMMQMQRGQGDIICIEPRYQTNLCRYGHGMYTVDRPSTGVWGSDISFTEGEPNG